MIHGVPTFSHRLAEPDRTSSTHGFRGKPQGSKPLISHPNDYQQAATIREK